MHRNPSLTHALSGADAAAAMEQDADVQLMLAVKSGDQAAFQRLFEKHAPALIGFAMHFVESRARAEEITQDVFLQVFRTRASYEPRARFSTWLYRMATNACVSDARRAERRLRAFSRDQPRQFDDGESLPQVADTEARTAEENLMSAQGLDALRMKLAALPPQQRAALWLARVEGMSYEEVADALSCSVSAVKSLVHRATVAMRAQYPERSG